MNYKREIPVAMLFKKFYCCKCGKRLERNPIKRTVSKGDPGYREYRRIGKTIMIGDVRVTEYNFRCTTCGQEFEFDDQCVIARIQKRLGKHVLSETEIKSEKPSAVLAEKKKRRVTEVIVYTVFWTVMIAICLYVAMNKLN